VVGDDVDEVRQLQVVDPEVGAGPPCDVPDLLLDVHAIRKVNLEGSWHRLVGSRRGHLEAGCESAALSPAPSACGPATRAEWNISGWRGQSKDDDAEKSANPHGIKGLRRDRLRLARPAKLPPAPVSLRIRSGVPRRVARRPPRFGGRTFFRGGS